MGRVVRFPGSPTIRIDGRDVDPTYVDPGDYTPRCRLYRTSEGLRGLPECRWIEDALRGPASDPDGVPPTSKLSDDLRCVHTGSRKRPEPKLD